MQSLYHACKMRLILVSSVFAFVGFVEGLSMIQRFVRQAKTADPNVKFEDVFQVEDLGQHVSTMFSSRSEDISMASVSTKFQKGFAECARKKPITIHEDHIKNLRAADTGDLCPILMEIRFRSRILPRDPDVWDLLTGYILKNPNKWNVSVLDVSSCGDNFADEIIEPKKGLIFPALQVFPALQEPNNILTKLNLRHHTLTSTSMEYLGNALQHPNNRLTDLNLDGCGLNGYDLAHITRALQNPNNNLTTLNLANNRLSEGFDSSYIIDFVSALRHPNNRLKRLDLSDDDTLFLTSVTPLIAEAIEAEDSKLTTLTIGNSRHSFLRDQDVQRLATALKHPNNKVTELDFRVFVFSPVTLKAAEHLKGALLDENNKLTSLRVNIRRHPLSLDFAKVFESALEHPNCKLRSIIYD